jgi:hypothetical protein
MADDLLGYLLGASDGAEREIIRNKLEHDEELQSQLLALERQLAPLEAERWNIEPPKGLADRTCALIFNAPVAEAAISSPGSTATENGVPLSSAIAAERAETPTGWIRWSFADVCLAAGMSIAALFLLAPGILKSRELARLNLCQENLRSLGVAMPVWAGLAQGYLPPIPASGNAAAAGFYAPQLMRAGIVNADKTFVCPNSYLAKIPFHVPAITTVYAAKGAELIQLQRQMGGSYYAGLGYVQGGELRGRRLSGSRTVPLLAESLRSHTSHQTWKAGNVMNVLFEDGHVARVFVPRSNASSSFPMFGRSSSRWQDMLVSDRGMVEAGRSKDDVVLAPSWAKPFPYAIENSLINDPTPMDVQSILEQMDPHDLNVGSVLEQPQTSSPYPWVLE